MFDIPVTVIAFNRPAVTARLIRRLATVRPSRLFVVCDGPRKGVAGENQATSDVRRLFERLPWSCEVVRNFSEQNLGCHHRVVTGLDWVFDQVDRSVILEDDCLPCSAFFPYCEQLLARYADDCRVASVCGMTHDVTPEFPLQSYRFSRYCFVWGWATWRRAWRLYDGAMTPLHDGSIDAVLRANLPDAWSRMYWKMLLQRCSEGRINTWDYQWVLTCWKQGLVHAIPSVSLVENIGIGEDSTHTKKTTTDLGNILTVQFPLVHPLTVEANRTKDNVIEQRIFSKSAMSRLRWLVRKYFS